MKLPAEAILIAHLAIVGFNIFGLVAVPIGKWLGWAFVRGFRWRLVHLLSLAAVAFQAALGRACFLTLWESDLTAEASGNAPMPLVASWLNSVLYWPLPLWVFAMTYALVFLYALMLWWWVPPRMAPRAQA